MPGTLTAHAKTLDLVPRRRQGRARHGDRQGFAAAAITGNLQAHSDGQGVSFVPNKAFDGNERVTVTTDRNVVNAANGDFAFEIGEDTTRALRPVEAPDVGRGSVQSFGTRPDLDPPAVTITTAKPGARPASSSSRPRRVGTGRPDDHRRPGEIVWFKAMTASSRPTSAPRTTTASPC